MKTDHPLPFKDRRAVRAGRLLDVAGQIMLPVGVGALFGFFAADRGMRLLPDLLEAALGWSLVALAFIGVGRLLRGRLYVSTPEGIRLRKRVVALLLVLGIAVAARLAVYYTQKPSPLTSLPRAEFELAFRLDTQRYTELTRGMALLNDNLDRQDIPRPGKTEVLTAEEEAALLDAWRSINDYALALDQIRVFWEDWYRFDPSRVERSFHIRSYLLTYAAELALYENASRFTSRVINNSNAKKFLDNPHPELGLPENSFSRFREQLLGVRDQARVLAGHQYLELADAGFGAESEANALSVDWLWQDCLDHLRTIDTIAPIDRAILTTRADTQILKRGVRRVWFPVQANAADVMGDIRVRRIGWYLIPPEQQEQADQKMLPGDILVSRKNWYLSNIGLPGFWPHAILYLGAPEKFDAYFDTPEIRAWIREISGRDLTLGQYVESRYPAAWRAYRVGDESGPHRLIEAVGEGVIFNTLAHASGDYLAAIRPRLDDKARAQAIIEAFSHWGKPYDFDFDFATDHALVCTELVWRAYRPAPGKEGLELPLSRVAGRMTLPANELIRYSAEHLEGDERAFDFVLFIDAKEKERSTFFSDEASFRATSDRVKWDIVQK